MKDIEMLQATIAQLPGFLAVVNLDCKCIAINQSAAHAFGYSSILGTLGITPKEMRCKAVESADAFIEQNEQILQHENALTLIDIHTYAKDEKKFLLTNKKPFYLQEKLAGVIGHATELTSAKLQQICERLIETDKYFYPTSSKNRSYQINNYSHTSLTSREQDCMSYLVRGKTMKQIAQLMHISPRTVESHLTHIKEKLNCKTKSDLIEVGILQGYLNLIPRSLFNNNMTEIIS